ncbi:gliding motility-associated C-terminal domain-containing protein [Neolewinella aurantiaca]|uniref:Gliding motility-associated C-terminal domain-containing protein n=1 Tax=Neolewinella aurantiaca TaxID=2602767 RepID=A0A5C7FLY1_9BACT|nr:gliding motility-associated C-terminal domain-containing protein [Neolewinella aurantiaca]TXF88389.1 gliding motility-associated C-terminal domain-containing protein [Neolewinella aurantiaca]
MNLKAILFFAALLLFGTAGRAIAQTASPEQCANGIDDDQDGLIDLNDSDCDCAVIEPVSLIPNPSFEDIECCPGGRSELYCADVWIQASQPTTDFIHDCGWTGWDNLPPPRPFPDGEGILGFRDGRPAGMDETEPRATWKEYAGACLLRPLQAGTTYRFEFDLGFVGAENSPDINISFFGTTDCNNLPFGQDNEELGCPTNGPGWVRLGSRKVITVFGGGWRKAFIEVTPTENIAAIAIGPDCQLRPSNVHYYYFFDNLLLDELESFNFSINGTDHPCSPNYRLEVPARENFTCQWYKEGIALPGETGFRLSQNYGEGTYQAVIDDGTGCRKSDEFTYVIPVIDAPVSATLCPGDFFRLGDREIYESGSYVDTLSSFQGCDSIVRLELTVLEELRDTVDARIFPDETYAIDYHSVSVAGTYDLPLVSGLGCDSIVMLNLSYYEVYQPTAFSPNGDGINDRFMIAGGADLVEVRDLRVYDRWGSLLATGTDWDGRHGTEAAAPGLYVYTVVVVMDDGKERFLAGAVMLLR